MSSSPVVIARLSSRSSTGSKHEEEVINAWEAEEERIINLLSRKLEQLKEEKVQLENALEAESESHVNRLTRELATLRARQAAAIGADDTGAAGPSTANLLRGTDPRHPTSEAAVEALRRENDMLRARIVGVEQDYVRVVRQCDIYREELIDHRRRLGIDIDNLVGAAAQANGNATGQPIHLRSSSSSSPTAALHPLPTGSSRPPVPIPRSNSQIHVSRAPVQRAPVALPSDSGSPRTPSANTTPLSSGATSPFSSIIGSSTHGVTASSSLATDMTTPPSSASINAMGLAATAMPLSMLTYPSVPPPSLSSSLGSPVQQTNPPRWGHGGSRHSSVERGGRVAETGSLSRRGSQGAGAATRPSQIQRASASGAVVESVPESPVEAVLLG